MIRRGPVRTQRTIRRTGWRHIHHIEAAIFLARGDGLELTRLPQFRIGERGFSITVPGLNLWVIGGLLGRLHLGGVVRRCKGIGWISAPVGTANQCLTRLAVKPCALQAHRPRGCGA